MEYRLRECKLTLARQHRAVSFYSDDLPSEQADGPNRSNLRYTAASRAASDAASLSTRGNVCRNWAATHHQPT